MKIIHREKGLIKIKVESQEDLWHLSQVIDPGDLVSSKTTRKIKIGDDNNQKVVKKTLHLEIKAEKNEFKDSTLRISGTITQGPDDIPLASHHTISVEENSELRIIKERWLKFQDDIIKEASSTKVSPTLLVVMDREEAFFAKLKRNGYEILSTIKGNVQKKRSDTTQTGDFYKDILTSIQEYDKRFGLNHIILASPSFWKEDFLKRVSDPSLKGKIIQATCSTVGRNSFDELLRRDEVKSALKADRITKEINLVEKLLSEISKEGNAVYGKQETIRAGESGAVSHLLILDTFIQDTRSQGTYESIDRAMKTVDSMEGEIIIVSHDHEGGKKLAGLGGIAGITRYKFS